MSGSVDKLGHLNSSLLSCARIGLQAISSVYYWPAGRPVAGQQALFVRDVSYETRFLEIYARNLTTPFAAFRMVASLRLISITITGRDIRKDTFFPNASFVSSITILPRISEFSSKLHFIFISRKLDF